MSHSDIAKTQNQMLPILFWHLDVGRFHAAGIGVGLGCIFAVDGGWAGAIAGKPAPTGYGGGLSGIVSVGLGGSFSIGGGRAGAIASRLAPTGGFGWGLGFGVGLEVFGAFLCLGQRGRFLGCGAMDQRICSAELITVLMLLLACNACYTSGIDRPFWASGR
jgi:hypothetical protein